MLAPLQTSGRKLAVFVADGDKASVRGLPSCRSFLALKVADFKDAFCTDRLDDGPPPERSSRGEVAGEIELVGFLLRAVTSRIFFASPDKKDLPGRVADRPI